MNDYQAKSGIEQRVLDNLSSAVLVFDGDLRLKYINPAGEMLLALSSRQVVGHRVNELLHCPGGVVESNLTRAKESGQPFTEREHPLHLAEGNLITVDCTVIPIRLEAGAMEYLVEMQQVDRQLRITREERLLSRNQTTRALVRSLAHEVKNPLGGLRGAAQLLERELPDASLQEYTQVIIQEADRLQKLVDTMLGPNQMPKREAISIHQVLERVCTLIQAESEGIHIVKDYDPSIPAMLGDFDQLIQAFLNIMRNGARAAGSQGQLGIRTRILRQFTIGTVRHRLVIHVELSDNGPGISAEMQERIFFPMVSGNSDGMGLGLSISQELINRHKGLIEFTSKPGETIFSVLLPLEPADG
jgi:two-component system nitrogen regulation sensor histidine kinase GlnL